MFGNNIDRSRQTPARDCGQILIKPNPDISVNSIAANTTTSHGTPVSVVPAEPDRSKLSVILNSIENAAQFTFDKIRTLGLYGAGASIGLSLAVEIGACFFYVYPISLLGGEPGTAAVDFINKGNQLLDMGY